MTLHLIRGWPGSGKTRHAWFLEQMYIAARASVVHFEADQYYVIEHTYLWDGTQVKHAHNWCQWRTRTALPRYDHVIVANTFTRIWEMQPYLDMTDDVKVYRCSGNYENVHGVPPDMVQLMKDRMEDFPGETYV